MEVSRSGYYSYLKNKNNDVEQDEKLVFELKVLHKKTNKSYGSRRMSKAMLAQGYKVGRYKMRRLMRQNGIYCKQRRRYTTTTKVDKDLAVADNILNRNFKVEKPNKSWVADITYLWTNEGWIYISAVLDLFSRRVIGWSIADHMKSDLVENALNMAKFRRQPLSGFLHHSDRGSQYASQKYKQILNKMGATVSMSRKGNCWDNAVMERFFGTLKTECTDDKNYKTQAEAKKDIINFIEDFYNSERLHSTLNYLSPAQYEKNFENRGKSVA